MLTKMFESMSLEVELVKTHDVNKQMNLYLLRSSKT